MKRTLVVSMISLLCALFMTGCSGNKKEAEAKKRAAVEDSNAYLKVLPADALMMAKVDVGNMLGKSEILDNTVVKTGFASVVEFVPENMQALLKKIYNDPKKSGVDVTKPMFMAFTSLKPVEAVVTIAMHNVDAFEKMLTTFTNGAWKFEKRDGLKYVVIDEDEIEIAYDSDKIILAFSERYANARAYASLSAGEMAVGEKKFDPIFKGDDDVMFVVNLEPLMDVLVESGELANVDRSYLDKYFDKNTCFNMALCFEKGYANLKVDVNGIREEYRKAMEHMICAPTHRHFKYIPANCFAVMNGSYDMGKSYEEMIDSGLFTELNDEGISNDLIKEICKAIKGDITFALWANGENVEDIQFMAAVDCNDRSVFDMLISFIKSEFDATMLNGDLFALNVNRRQEYNYYTNDYEYVKNGNDYYLMYKDGAIMVMPDNIYREIENDGELTPLKRNLESNRVFASMSENVIVDMNKMADVASLMVRNDDSATDDDRMALEVLNMLKSLTISGEPCSVDVRLNLNDSSANSLKVIVDKAISLAMQNIGF